MAFHRARGRHAGGRHVASCRGVPRGERGGGVPNNAHVTSSSVFTCKTRYLLDDLEITANKVCRTLATTRKYYRHGEKVRHRRGVCYAVFFTEASTRHVMRPSRPSNCTRRSRRMDSNDLTQRFSAGVILPPRWGGRGERTFLPCMEPTNVDSKGREVVQWTNPHVVVWILVQPRGRRSAGMSLETTSPAC